MKNVMLAIITMAAMAFAGPVAAIEMQDHHQQQQQIIGTLMEMNENEIVVRTDDQEEMTFQFGPELAQQSQELRQQIERGDRVMVEYRTGVRPDEYIATSLRPVDAQMERQYQDRQQRDRQQHEQMQRQHEQMQQQHQQMQHQQISGTIIQKQDDSFTLRSDDGRIMNFQIDPERAQLRDEEMRERMREREERMRQEYERAKDPQEKLEELEEGDRVTVDYERGETPTQFVVVSIRDEEEQQRWQDQQRQDEQQHQMGHQQIDSISGTITLKHDESFTLRADDGRTMTFQIDEQRAQLRDDPQMARQQRQQHQQQMQRFRNADPQEQLENLDQGDRVTVHYLRGDTPTEFVVISVAEEYDRAQPGVRNQQDQNYQQDQWQEDTLPATSSTLPLIAGAGMLALLAALGLRVVARREDQA